MHTKYDVEWHIYHMGPWRAAYQWDKNGNPEMMRVHHRLTDEHIELSGRASSTNWWTHGIEWAR